MSSREFVDTITRDLLGSRVFVFTPRGEVQLDYFIYRMTIFAVQFIYKIIKKLVYQNTSADS